MQDLIILVVNIYYSIEKFDWMLILTKFKHYTGSYSPSRAERKIRSDRERRYGNTFSKSNQNGTDRHFFFLHFARIQIHVV